MANPDPKLRLESALKRREEVTSKIQRILGRLEESERTREALRAECRAKNIDPDNLDAAIIKVKTTLESKLEQFEQGLAAAESALEPFTMRTQGK